MSLNDSYLHLIANPQKKKKTIIFENIDRELSILMQKKYKRYIFDDKIFEKINEHNLKLVEKYTIEKTSEKVVNDCINELLENT